MKHKTHDVMQLAPPLDSDWLLHSFEGGYQDNLTKEFGTFVDVSWCNMATLSP